MPATKTRTSKTDAKSTDEQPETKYVDRFRPKFDVNVLMRLIGCETATELSERLDEPLTTTRRRLERGVSYFGADYLAVKVGMMPGQVWADWDEYEVKVKHETRSEAEKARFKRIRSSLKKFPISDTTHEALAHIEKMIEKAIVHSRATLQDTEERALDEENRPMYDESGQPLMIMRMPDPEVFELARQSTQKVSEKIDLLDSMLKDFQDGEVPSEDRVARLVA